MAKTAQLTIDITEELIKTGFVRSSARSRRFVELVFGPTSTQPLAFEWDDGHDIEVSRSPSGDLVLSSSWLFRWAFQADQLRLFANLQNGAMSADLFDGSALFVLHVRAKADELTLARLLDKPLPAATAHVGDERTRAAWAHARNEVLLALAEQEIRGPASLVSLQRYLAEGEAELKLRGEHERETDVGSILADIERARRRRRKRSSNQQETGLLFRTFEYEPRSFARDLMLVMRNARQVFGDEAGPVVDTAFLRRVLSSVARGEEAPSLVVEEQER